MNLLQINILKIVVGKLREMKEYKVIGIAGTAEQLWDGGRHFSDLILGGGGGAQNTFSY